MCLSAARNPNAHPVAYLWGDVGCSGAKVAISSLPQTPRRDLCIRMQDTSSHRQSTPGGLGCAPSPRRGLRTTPTVEGLSFCFAALRRLSLTTLPASPSLPLPHPFPKAAKVLAKTSGHPFDIRLRLEEEVSLWRLRLLSLPTTT